MKLNIQLFASGESSSFTDSPLQMKITWSSSPSEDVQNASNVTARIYGRRTSGSTKGRQWNGYMNIGGNIHNFSEIYTKTSTTVGTSWVLMAYYTDTIVHDSDGSKTITIYGGLGGPSGTTLASKWCEGNTTATLDRLSAPATLNSVDITNFVSQGKFTPNFTINQQGLYYGIGIISYTPIELIVSWNNTIAVSNGVEATLSDSQKQTLWNVLDGKNNRTANDIKFILYSYSDSARTNEVGSTDIDFINNISIPSYTLNWNWNITTIEDIHRNNQYGNHPLSYYAGNNYVKGLSLPKIYFNATSSTGYTYGKTITYTLNGVARTSPYEDTSWSGGNTYTLTASDGRASPITTTITINVVNYFIPYLSNIRVVRPIPTDDVVRVSYTANYYDGTSLSNLTNAVYNFYYRESESDSWTFVSTLSGSGTSGSQTFSNVDIDNLNYKKPFYYKIEFTDRIGNTPAVPVYTSSIPKGLPVWNAYTDSTDTNVLNVNGSETIDGTLNASGVAHLNGGLYTKNISAWEVKTNGNDLVLNTASSSSDDSGDIVWSYGTTGEKARLFTRTTFDSNTYRLSYRAFDKQGNQVVSTDIATTKDLGDLFRFARCYKTITVPSGDSSQTLYPPPTISGYNFLGIMTYSQGYADQWLISYGYYGNNIVAEIRSKYPTDLTTQTIVILMYIKSDYYNTMCANYDLN